MKQTKKDLRKASKHIRAKLYSEGKISEISDRITKKIRALDDFKSAKNVMLFYPKEEEVNILGLMEDKGAEGKSFYLPRCEACDYAPIMSICPYKKGDELFESDFGILEPVNECIDDVSILDIIFVPALCADKFCHRIGYGAGYYDYFFRLHENLKAKKIIVLPLEMYVDEIMPDARDVPCDMVVSQD